MLKGKNILLGISASIAAYKAAFLVRLFIKEGANVKVVITDAAKEFVTPLTLATLSKNPVLSEFIENPDEGTWTNHVELGLWADYMIIAPATANTLAKMANGVCDNLLLATYLSAKCPVFVAPAMDLDMYKHGSTKDSLAKLEDFGNLVVPAGSGELASGLEGEGRMAEPEEIVSFLESYVRAKSPLLGKNVLINAGPTYEKIDDVRFIGNFSSGKMGIAIADAAFELGANVHLVLGPSNLKPLHSEIKLTPVVSASDMLEACGKGFENVDYAILSAAVADYTPITKAEGKIKKKTEELSIDLTKTQDILQTLGSLKKDNQTLVGFALETENEEEYAKGKLHKKNADFIVLNSLQDKGAGFGTDTNKVSIFSRKGNRVDSELLSKMEIAQLIWKTITTTND
ncbi:MAG: bifunctional phosphopantothenoylcysteine decarboxylase/phosphopantothenate--cysteine ligase CoaBC [Schleiferiaceae bacterium]|jgi:phosphopantothenoylcysteine decarboxylase/phosphopantothenate--cysteine ligase|nr:bifunctional phosphopantothenoylcysteine decarboxylase/phosphopantothenate--cysteine ligase CoaBC [Schleiferiaceae bacterium]